MPFPLDRAGRSALKVALVYLIFGCLWILVTDSALHYLIQDLDKLETWQKYKGILFVALSGLVIFFSNRYETNRRLRAEIDLIDTEARTKEFVLNANEEERNRISSELHDGVQQELAGVSMMLQTLKEQEKEEIPGTVDDIQRSLDESIQEIRKVSHFNSSFRIDEMGVGGAIEEIVERTRREKGAKGALSIRPIEERQVNQFTAVNLYRISQELLQNLIKHSDADRFELRIEKNGSDSFTYCFWENGSNEDKGKEGFGKRSIKKRIQCLGGHILKSSPKDGKEFRFLFLDLNRDALRERITKEHFDGDFLPLEKQKLRMLS